MKKIPSDQLELPLGMPKPHYCPECGRRVKKYGLGGGCKAEKKKSRLSIVIELYVEMESDCE